MSSGTNETNPINGVTGVAGMPFTGLDQFNQGIQTLDDYQKYLDILQNTSEFQPKLFEPLLKTLDNVVLNSIGESYEFGKVMKKLLDIAYNSWDEDMIKSLLKTMDHIPLDLDVLIKNSLGFGVKNIKKKAIELKSVDIIELTSVIIEKWKILKRKLGLNANGKRNSPERSSSTSPPSSVDSPVKKHIKLAIQKEPPTRPKAMTDPNFLSTLRESKKFPNTRPIYHVEKILEGIESKSGKPSSVSNSDSSLKRTESCHVSDADSPKKKRVRFKDDLVEIREYEKNPEEWTNFDNNGKNVEHQYGNARDLDVKEGHNIFIHLPQIAWYTPLEIKFDLSNQNLNVRTLLQTDEALAQDEREGLALAAIYTSPQHIPPSPAEPDEIPNPNAEGSVPVIPLNDIEALPPSTHVVPSSSSSPPSSSSAPYNTSFLPAAPAAAPIAQSNLITNDDLHTVIAAMHAQPFTIPQQSNQEFNRPATNNISLAPASAANPYSQSFNSGASSFNTANALQNAAQPTTPPTIAGIPGQPPISNKTVEDMLKNNPNIMQSLRQLSYLAAGNNNNDNSTGIAPQQIQVPRQPAYQQQQQQQQAYHPYQHQQHQQQAQPLHNQQYQHNDWNNNNNHNDAFQQRKKNKARNTRGRGNRGGSHGQGRGNGRYPVCKYFNLPEGCHYGESCIFIHENPHNA